MLLECTGLKQLLFVLLLCVFFSTAHKPSFSAVTDNLYVLSTASQTARQCFMRLKSAACNREQKVAVVKSMCNGDGEMGAFIVSGQLSCLCDKN